MEVPETARKRQTPSCAHDHALFRGAALAALLCAACNLDNPGTSPPAGKLSYPIALAVGKIDANGKPGVLYVVNSNFDLRYNAGSIHAYDLEAINQAVADAQCERVGVSDAGVPPVTDAGGPGRPDAGMPDAGTSDAAAPDAGGTPAGDAGAQGDAGTKAGGAHLDAGVPAAAFQQDTVRGVLCDGLDPAGTQCCFTTNRKYLVPGGEVLIDSYAAGVATSPDFRHLYVAQRGRNSLLSIDTDPAGALSCGSDKGRCTRGTNAGDPDLDPESNFAAQPKALAVGRLSDLLGMSTEDGGMPTEDGGMSTADYPVFIVSVHEGGQIGLSIDDGKSGPVLHSVVPGSPAKTAVAWNKDERLFYVSSAGRGSLERYAVLQAEKRWILYPSVSVPTSVDVTGAGGAVLSGSGDIRDIRFDVDDPNRMFVLMRGVGVNAVLVLERDAQGLGNLRVTSATRVGEGPSRLAHAKLGNRNLLFVTCFDARAIFVLDESNGELLSVIRGLSGPFELTVDEARQRIYVADFRANVLRVIDVKGLADYRLPPPRIIATLGEVRFGGKLQ